jgi:hypothetical protein
LATLISSSALAAPNVDIVVVTNKENPVEKLEPEAARRLFLKLDERWPDGRRARPVDVLGDTPARRTYLARLLKMTAADLQRHWVSLRYQNGAAPSPNVKTWDDVVHFVAAYRGGIGFLPASELTPERERQLKVLAKVVAKP